MARVLPLLQLASILSLIGVVAPLMLSLVIGGTMGLGAGRSVALIVGWFVQGLLVFAAPTMLIVRFAALQTRQAYVVTALAMTIVMSLIIVIEARSRSVPVSFSLMGTIVFGIGAICAGLYLFRHRAALSRTV